MKTYTQDKLAAVLARHAEWLEDSDKGEMANLRGADLSGADLSGADLSGADHKFCLPVADDRGYYAIAILHTDGWRIFSGCRAFTVAEAVAHWGAADYHTTWLGHDYVRAEMTLNAWSTLCGLNNGPIEASQ